MQLGIDSFNFKMSNNINNSRIHQMTGIYRTYHNIEKFKIRVTFKTIISLLKIPQFPQFVTTTAQSMKHHGEIATDATNNEECEVIELEWQEKRLSSKEIQACQYKENCKTDLEKKYNELIRTRGLGAGEKTTRKMFTYTREDQFNSSCGEPINNETNEENTKVTIEGESNVIPPASRPFGASQLDANRGFESYYIMVELNVEIVIISIKWRKSDGLLVIYPDFNNIQTGAYVLEVDANTKQMYHFAIENISPKQSCHPNKIRFPFEIAISLNKPLDLPSAQNNNRAHLLFQILSAQGFEYDNLHVRFAVRIPQMAQIVNGGQLCGSTHSSYRNSQGIWHFGYCHEVSLQSFDRFNDDDYIDIDLKVISIDIWKRERFEGLSTVRVPMMPGWSKRDTVACYRIQTGSLVERLERFFIGDRHLQENFLLEGQTKHQEGVSRYGVQTVSTGVVTVVVYLIIQNRLGKVINKKVSQ